MRTRRALVVLVAVLGTTAVTTVAAAPGGASTPSSGAASGATRTRSAAPSGTIRVAAEEELSCADWIASCGGLAWGSWALGNLTLPQALTVDADGNYTPGAILTGMPTLSAGPPMTVTYHIKPEAVWSDGQPITSADFAYTWKQITTGKDIYDATGYTDIASIDTSDPKTAVVTFKQTFAAWRDLWGGFYYVLPSHLLDGKDRHKLMKDGYAFSGGPWMLDGGKSGWKKGRTLTLVPNPKYWGTQPSIAKVVFQFVTESAAELDAVKTGQVASAYITPSTGSLDQIKAQSNLAYEIDNGNSFEAIWLNAKNPPLDSQAVRQSIGYAIDRQAIVSQILKPSVGTGNALQSFIVPTFKQYFVPAFADYKPDPSKVDSLMTGDGWTKKNGTWTKNGKPVSVEISTTTGNESRSLTEQIMRSELTQAGFKVQIRNQSPDTYFGTTVPKGKFEIGIFASDGTPDPGLCVLFCSKGIPSKANSFSGQNITWTNDPTIDSTWTKVDQDLDPTTRTADVKAGQVALADDAASLPLYQSPLIFVYDKTKIGGNVTSNTVMGPFFSMNEWTLK